ncbi:MAG: Nif3-like dinuclear metal center hexameric protein [Sphaerochaeta sp.]|jgi:dinuclear metal center YbgI/SA1388 family protein|nr:Nif3-like dinuclear metal center hexameric protein [Sphaerochaeta sp.]MDX9915999.1 Nif3-like dinuclear metal center hexameric protein [Sphaerochaeta sp.]
MKQNDLVSYLDSYLQIASFAPIDYSLNGLVVGTPDEKEVRTVAVAVDASLSTFEKAIEEGCDLLIVHHGLFWGSPIAITGAHYRRVKALLENNVSLYAAHLPLDAHPEVGNNIQMARALALEEIEPFSPYKGVPIGFAGRFGRERDVSWVCDRLGFDDPTVLMLGKSTFLSVGIVSGGASDDLSEAIASGLDLFITGEVKHQAYHEACEAHTTVIGGGHYNTEVFGVRALGEHLAARFGLDVRFIANPTGL